MIEVVLDSSFFKNDEHEYEHCENAISATNSKGLLAFLSLVPVMIIV